MKISFEVIKARGKRCEVVNGRRVWRQKTFEQTVNPWNKNPDGTVKTPDEVYEAVKKEAIDWQNEVLPPQANQEKR